MTNPRSPRTRPFVLLLAALAVTACDVEPEPDALSEPEELTPLQAPASARLPIEPADEHDPARTTTLVRDSDGSDDPELSSFVDSMPGVVGWQPVFDGEAIEDVLDRIAAERPDPEEGFSYVGMVTERGHYLVEIEDEAMMLVRGRLEMVAEGGMAGPDSEEPLPEDDELEFRGWSNGFDSRVRLTGNSIPDKVGRVASMVGQCSGALIGRRIVRTAAHCLIQSTALGGTVAGSVTFDYRRDATSVPVSTSTSTFYYGGNYLPSGCGMSLGTDTDWGYFNNVNACTWADWAMLILPTNWNGNTWHSWFGYKGLVSGNEGMELQSGGYPGCGRADSPAGCVNQAYYRDNSAPCTVTGFTSGTAKFRSGCDTSPGNSGGPVWQEGTAYLIGHCQWQECGTCANGNSAPNHFLGHDDWLFNFQNNLRNTYP